MADPRVTIVTPSLNQGRFIRATIESVLAQDYPNLEYIIMDGGSTDETAAIAGEYASRLTFVSEPDRGQSHAVNKGFRRGQGEILAWINSDDLLLEGAVTTAVDTLVRAPRAAAVYGEGRRIGEDGRGLGRFPHTEPFNLWKLVHLSDYILQQSLYMRRSALDEVGYLNEDLHYTMDWDLLIRIGKRFPVRYIPREMGAIREYAAAKSFRGGRGRVREIKRLLRWHSGMRRPPGARLYALETNPGPLPIRILTGRWAERLKHSSQGLFRDGWAGPHLRYMLPSGPGPIVIRGLCPTRQKLRVLCNRRVEAEMDVEPGTFRIEVNNPGLANLEIWASNWTRPASNEGATDRRLAWVVQAIERLDTN